MHHGAGLQLDSLAHVDGPLDLAADHGLDGEQVALDRRARREEDLPARANRTPDPSFDLDDAFRLKIADDGHVLADDRERNAVALPALGVRRNRRVARTGVAGTAGEDAHHLPSLTMDIGSTRRSPRRISKCRCGAVDRPLFPESPMTRPAA